MLHTHDSIPVVGKRNKVLDVREVKEIAIDEHCPASEASKVRGEETSEGELRRLSGTTVAPVKSGRAEVGLAERMDLKRD